MTQNVKVYSSQFFERYIVHLMWDIQHSLEFPGRRKNQRQKPYSRKEHDTLEKLQNRYWNKERKKL